MKGRFFFVLFLALGCGCKDERGNIVIDLRGCQSAAHSKAEPPPAFSDAKLAFAQSALAFVVHEQESVELVMTSGQLHCGDVKMTPNSSSVVSALGPMINLTAAPVPIDDVWDQAGSSHSLTPEHETWRLTHVFAPKPTDPNGTFWSWRSTNVDVARGVATLGKHTALHVAVAEHPPKGMPKGAAFSGLIDVEGCGEVPYALPVRLQPGLAVTIGPAHVAIRGATYRKRPDGGGELRISTAPSDCEGNDGADLEIMIRRDNVAFMGKATSTSYNYNSHGLVLTTVDAGAAADQTIRVQVSGAFYRPMNMESEPRDDFDRLTYERNVHIAGIVDALVCPDTK